MEQTTTDVATVSRARHGDPDAFRQLVERHSKPIFRVAYRMTGNEHDADDVVQETLLRAWRQMGSFEERANFSTWIHRIAVNCSLDLLRARNRHEKNQMSTTNNDDDDPRNETASSDPQPDRLMLSRELQE